MATAEHRTTGYTEHCPSEAWSFLCYLLMVLCITAAPAVFGEILQQGIQLTAQSHHEKNGAEDYVGENSWFAG